VSDGSSKRQVAVTTKSGRAIGEILLEIVAIRRNDRTFKEVNVHLNVGTKRLTIFRSNLSAVIEALKKASEVADNMYVEAYTEELGDQNEHR